MSQKEIPASKNQPPPSLLAKHERPSHQREDDFEETRILFTLEDKHTPKVRKPRLHREAAEFRQTKRSWLVPGLMIAIACLVGITLLNQNTQEPYKPLTPRGQNNNAATSAPPLSVVVAPPPVPLPQEEPSDSAKIITENTQPDSNIAPKIQATEPHFPPINTELPQAASEQSSAPATVAPFATRQAAPQKISRQANDSATQKLPENKTSPGDAPSETTVVEKTKQPEKRADVDLIAALVAHIEHTPGQKAAPNTNKGVPKETQGSKGKVDIASLVKSCEKLGGRDARICKERVCEGNWGKEAACKKS